MKVVVIATVYHMILIVHGVTPPTHHNVTVCFRSLLEKTYLQSSEIIFHLDIITFLEFIFTPNNLVEGPRSSVLGDNLLFKITFCLFGAFCLFQKKKTLYCGRVYRKIVFFRNINFSLLFAQYKLKIRRTKASKWWMVFINIFDYFKNSVLHNNFEQF